jgi:divalent metal cation (Fe/Co/Zn/Cd) transporter
MQLGPEQVLLAVDIKFHRGIRVEDLESIIDRLESRIRASEPTVKRIFIEVEALKRKSNPGSNAAETRTAA